MKKNHYVIVTAFILLYSLILFWASQTEKSLTPNEIYSLIEQGETQIDLTSITDFEWTKVEVFGPYTTGKMIEDSMDIEFPFFNGGIDVIETKFILVFADGKKPVDTLYLSREYGDYTVIGNKFLVVE